MKMMSSIREHWPEYLMEAGLLGAFMVSVCTFIVLLGSPRSPVFGYIPDATSRLIVLAAAIGMAATLLIQSPWGKRSGAHLNPAVTLAFLWLKRMSGLDAFFYVVAQVVGASLGVLVVAYFARDLFTDPPVLYAITVPGSAGPWVAFCAEAVISLLLMAMILFFISSPRLIRFTAAAIGALIAVLIVVESPLSGTSMNPARTFASALAGMRWTHLWVYLCGPTLGMLIAAELIARLGGREDRACAKLLHPDDVRCIHCGFEPMAMGEAASTQDR